MKAAIALGIGLLPVLALRKALRDVLLDLCGTSRRAEFWWRYTWVMLLLTPVFFVLVWAPPAERTAFDEGSLETTLKSAILGVLVAMAGVGLVLVRFVQMVRTPMKPADADAR